jgi:hypothetical protein
MGQTEPGRTWVVYRMTVHGRPCGARAVCSQREWEALERDQPDYHTPLLAGIASEAEAERLARGEAAEPPPAARKVPAARWRPNPEPIPPGETPAAP